MAAAPAAAAVSPALSEPPDFPRNGCCGFCWGRCPSFSWVSTAFIAAWGIVVFALLLSNSANLLLLPLVALPPALIAYFAYWRVLRRELGAAADDDLALRVCAAGCVPGAACATLAEFVLGIVFFLVCFGAQLGAAAQAAEPGDAGSGGSGGGGGGGGSSADSSGVPVIDQHGFAFVAYLFLSAYVTAALVEESVKAGVVRCQSVLTGCCGPERACCLQRPHADPRVQAYMTITLLLAASVGFSTVENMIYVLSAGGEGPAPALGERVLLAFVRGAVSLPVHAICGCFTGMRLTIRDAQRRHRDAAALASGSGGGGNGGGAAAPPMFVMLPSGVVVQVVAPGGGGAGAAGGGGGSGGGYSAPPAAAAFAAPAGASAGAGAAPPLQAVGLLAPAASAAGAAAAARAVAVWGWPRVLWPAVLIHGSFDFASLLSGQAADEAGAIAVVVVSALVVLVASGWALRSQLGAVLAVTTRGGVPERVTFAPVWWPERLRGAWGGGAAARSVGGGMGEYAAVGDGMAPGATESMLGGEGAGGSAGARESAEEEAPEAALVRGAAAAAAEAQVVAVAAVGAPK